MQSLTKRSLHDIKTASAFNKELRICTDFLAKKEENGSQI
jgi:hypothetical protein